MITQAQLKEVLHYNPETGVFTWIRPTGRRVRVGERAGSPNSGGYWQIKVLGTMYKAHRLAFLYMEGTFPEEDVDHINNDPADNRWENLRRATTAQNCRNSVARKNNKLGSKNIYKTDYGYRVKVSANGKRSQKRFKTREEAEEYATHLRNSLHQQFARHS